MHHQDRRGRAELQGEIAVGNRVEAVAGDPVEAELLGHELPVDGEGGAGQGPGAQGQKIEAPQHIGHAPGVAANHLVVSQHVVGKEDRLGGLQVGVAGHDDGEVGFGLAQQRLLQLVEVAEDVLELVAQIQAHIGRHLVVAGAGGVQFAAHRADLLDEPGLDVHVDVFEADLEFEVARLDVGQNRFEAGDDLTGLVFADDVLFRQHPRVGDGALDVVAVHALVESDGGGEFFYELVGGLGKPAGPGFLAHALIAPYRG